MPIIRLLHVWVAIECRECQELATAGFGSRYGIPGRDRVLFGSVSRQEFLCRDMVIKF